MYRLKHVHSRYYPMKAWAFVILATFVVESAIMVVLPHLLPLESELFLAAAADASILTLLIAPIVWWLIVRPLDALLELRTKHLNEVFLSIEEERRRVAAELHDGVGQSLTMLVSGLRTAAGIADAEDLQTRCRELQEVSREALVEVKRITAGLRPSLLDDLGLASAVARLTDDVVRHEGIEISLDTTGLPATRLPSEVETATYRIIQESLNNVVKHAKAKSGSVKIAIEGDFLVAHITDQGCGLATRAEKTANRAVGHLGLSGMRERAILLGGEVTIESDPSFGTRVIASIPIETRLDRHD